MATTINLINQNVAANSVVIGSWQIQLDGSDLRFVYNGTDVARLSTIGDLIVLKDVDSASTP